MDSEKQGISRSSESYLSEEEEEQSDQYYKGDDYSDKQRSYGCIFCKRGFTNAQALGGHMNIHRKDRLKNKHITDPSSSSSSIPIKIITNSNSEFSQLSQLHPQKYYPYSPSQIHNYQPSTPKIINDCFVPTSTDSSSDNQQLWGSDLSLQFQPDHELGRRPIWNNDGIDLELRLGFHP